MLFNDRLSGLFAVGLGLVVVLVARTFPPMPGQNVGPSLFPTLIGTGLIAFGAWLILAGLRRERTAWVSFAPWASRPRMVANGLLVVVALVGFIVLAQPLGFFITSILFLATLMSAFGERRAWILPIAVIATIAIHYAFYSLLRVPLPWGVFEAIAW
jgi:putative tricarboxylic transport membrane protein